MIDVLRKVHLSSDIVTEEELNETISSIVHGLSDDVNPKLSIIADLVEEEVERVDSISASLSGYSKIGHQHSASEISSGLAPVATTGSYNDLTDKPDGVSLSDYAFLSTTNILSGEISGLTLSLSALSNNLCLEISSTNENLETLIDLVTDELSNNINPKLSTIADKVSAETDRLDTLSGSLSNYTSISAFNSLNDGLSDYTKISAHNVLESRVISTENQIGNILSILQYINDTEEE